MHSIMVGQKGIAIKLFGANLALKWLFTCVCSIVVDQIFTLRKAFEALHALKLLFTSVCSIMTGEKRIISELLGAKLALK
uniref:Putative secreted protein n=1 Tax=Ixodes ricinus TaxID=34613 RepID=A0A147BNR6_IXORI